MAQSMGESSKLNGNLSNEEVCSEGVDSWQHSFSSINLNNLPRYFQVYKVDTVNERLEKPKNDDSKVSFQYFLH